LEGRKIFNKKETDFSQWYTELLNKAELIEYGDVSGCYVLLPWAYSIWEYIQQHLDLEFKKRGVENAYFPLFVKRSALEKEKDHIAGFAPEVAWITRHDDEIGKDGKERKKDAIAIRPTSETIIYPFYAKWIRSQADLPIKLNQWCNVVRWEFKDPTPFIRSREFLWQEGHNIFMTEQEARDNTMEMLKVYENTYKDLLAIPTITGRKTEAERFAGAVYTTTCETFIKEKGKAIQAATSHYLGQHFSKIFDIKFPVEHGVNHYPYQNSWGFTTRSIGIMIMMHSDNQGLVLPPKIAPIQVVVVPIYKSGKHNDNIKNKCIELVERMNQCNIRAHFDNSSKRPGRKYNHWESRGVPIRIEIGHREVARNTITLARRDQIGNKNTLPNDQNLINEISRNMDELHHKLYEDAYERIHNNILQIQTPDAFINALSQGQLAKVPFCGRSECEEGLKEEMADQLGFKPKSLCVPLTNDTMTSLACIRCSQLKSKWTLFGNSF